MNNFIEMVGQREQVVALVFVWVVQKRIALGEFLWHLLEFKRKI